MKYLGDLLSEEKGAAGVVVDDEIHPNLVLYGLLHDFCVSSIIFGS